MNRLITFLCVCCMAVYGCNSGDQETQKKNTATLTSQKTIDPNSIVLIIASIDDDFPELDKSNDTTGFPMHEDDWRQVEFVSREYEKAIRQQVDSIRYIYDHDTVSGGYGFKRLYVRKMIPKPLTLPFSKFIAALVNNKDKTSTISMNGNQVQVKNGFSVTTGGAFYYGIKDAQNNITTLGISGAVSDEELSGSIKQLSAFLKNNHLFLVDWLHMAVLDEDNVQQLISLFETR